MRAALAVTLLGALCPPGGAARAAGAEHTSGFELGMRVGVAFPLGRSSVGYQLADVVGPAMPLTFELGYRIAGRYELVAAGQYALGTINATQSVACYTGNNRCAASSVGVGGEFIFHILGAAPVDPFLGIGSSYEWLLISATSQGKDYAFSLRGWNWLVAETGVEFPLGNVVRVGPFCSVSVGQYTDGSADTPATNGPVSAAVKNPAVHLWLSVGLRLVVLP